MSLRNVLSFVCTFERFLSYNTSEIGLLTEYQTCNKTDGLQHVKNVHKLTLAHCSSPIQGEILIKLTRECQDGSKQRQRSYLKNKSSDRCHGRCHQSKQRPRKMVAAISFSPLTYLYPESEPHLSGLMSFILKNLTFPFTIWRTK